MPMMSPPTYSWRVSATASSARYSFSVNLSEIVRHRSGEIDLVVFDPGKVRPGIVRAARPLDAALGARMQLHHAAGDAAVVTVGVELIAVPRIAALDAHEEVLEVPVGMGDQERLLGPLVTITARFVCAARMRIGWLAVPPFRV
jgi:hypothetical protein